MSLTPYLRDPGKRFGRAIFYESTDVANFLSGIPGYDGIKLGRWKYVLHTSGEKELYDVQKDPFELKSLHADPRYAGVMGTLAGYLAKFPACKGQAGPNACLVRGVKAPPAP
jgi:hypothetical protein